MICFEDLIWLFNSNEQSRNIIRMNIAEGALLYKYSKLSCDKNNGSILVEIGRKFGGSTAIMAANLKEKDRLFSIDIVFHNECNKNLSELYSFNSIEFINNKSEVIAKNWNKKIDFLLIDGDHSYSGVKKDIKLWTPWIKKCGYVFFHDVLGKKQELRPLIDNLLKSGWKEVARADSSLCLQKTV